MPHQKGDEILIFIANTLEKTIRKSDILGRYGGEEFIIFLSNIDRENLELIANNILNKIQRSNSNNFPITVSIGISHGIFKNSIENEIIQAVRQPFSAPVLSHKIFKL